MSYVSELMERVLKRNPSEPEFHQAVKEVLDSLQPVIDQHPNLVESGIIERLVEPERQIMFRVPWVDDHGEVQVNRGFRIEFNSAIGPYKGGLRFHPSVNASIIKFWALNRFLRTHLPVCPLAVVKEAVISIPKESRMPK